MLIKRSDGRASRQRLASAYQGLSSGGLDRRAFLRNAGLAGAGVAALAGIAPRMAEAQAIRVGAAGGVADNAKPIQRIKNICTHCSVGCTVTAEVQNGVWVGQEPSWESPINRGTHCAKGASVRELVHGDRALLERPEFKAMFLDDLLNGSRKQISAPLADVLLFSRPWGFELADVTVPVHWWHGDADHIIPFDHGVHAVTRLPDAELHVLPGESHLGGLGAGEEILVTLLEVVEGGLAVSVTLTVSTGFAVAPVVLLRTVGWNTRARTAAWMVEPMLAPSANVRV